jgi:hypothetical protein
MDGFYENWSLTPDVAERVSDLITEAVFLAAEENSWTQDDHCHVCHKVLDRTQTWSWDWVCSDDCAIEAALEEDVEGNIYQLNGYYDYCIRARGRWDPELLQKYLERRGDRE